MKDTTLAECKTLIQQKLQDASQAQKSLVDTFERDNIDFSKYKDETIALVNEVIGYSADLGSLLTQL